LERMRHGRWQRRRQRHRRVYGRARLGAQPGAPVVQERRWGRVAARGRRKRQTTHQGTIRLAEVMQWDFARVEVNGTDDIALLQRVALDIGRGMGFALAIAATDAQMRYRIVA